MSKQSKEARAAIERLVFQSNTPIVVALTGGWGEGKTYFWRENVVPGHPEKKSGYISVFGAESLAVIRERVALASSRLSDLAESGVVPEWLQKISGPVAGSIRRAANFWGGKIGVSDSIAVELLQSFGLKPGWIICIDDVERLSPSVGFDNFLGYVSELRDKWKLKVVLIFNKEPIDADKTSAFHRYQEKVIDRAIPFALDFRDVVNLAFRDLPVPNLDVQGEAHGKSELLGLRNIRVLVKARSYFEEVLQEVGSTAAMDFLRAALGSLLLFTYTRFSNQKPANLTFAVIAKHSEWSDRFRKTTGLVEEDEETNQDEAKELLGRYGYMMTDDLDRLLMSFVQTDVLDADRLRALHLEYQNDADKRALASQFREVWDRQYHGKVIDNSRELCDALEAALNLYLAYVPPGELDFALVVLSKLGRAPAATQYFNEFKRIRGQVFEQLDEGSMPMGPFAYPPLKAYLDGIAQSRKADTRTIDEVMAAAFRERFISQRDENRLAEFSVNDLVKYLTSHGQPKLTSKLQALTKGGNEKLQQMAFAAAKKIATMNPLNRMRMEGMGLVQAKARAKKRR